MLPVFIWKHRNYTNFGDELNGYLIGKILARDILVVRDRAYSPKLLAIGSLITNGIARPGDVVWGAGYRGNATVSHLNLDIRAVRGPLTSEHLERRGYPPIKFCADPALLLTRFLTLPIGGGGTKWVVHHEDTRIGGNVIDVRRPPLQVVEEIASADLIVSSSLHGIIVAEAYGIPAVLADGIEARCARIKFEDYYFSTGRTAPLPIPFERATARHAASRPCFPDLDAFLAEFPYDKF